jgi:hypothetical protein
MRKTLWLIFLLIFLSTNAFAVTYTPYMDVSLTEFSPARGKATKSITLTDNEGDFYHHSRGDNWDIGAVQYAAFAPNCTPNGSCNAIEPKCGEITNGWDNCLNVCHKNGPPCACVPDGLCGTVIAPCGQQIICTDNCGTAFTINGAACPPIIVYTTVSGFESWLTPSTLQTADNKTIMRYIKLSIGAGTSKVTKCYEIPIKARSCS